MWNVPAWGLSVPSSWYVWKCLAVKWFVFRWWAGHLNYFPLTMSLISRHITVFQGTFLVQSVWTQLLSLGDICKDILTCLSFYIPMAVNTVQASLYKDTGCGQDVWSHFVCICGLNIETYWIISLYTYLAAHHVRLFKHRACVQYKMDFIIRKVPYLFLFWFKGPTPFFWGGGWFLQELRSE